MKRGTRALLVGLAWLAACAPAHPPRPAARAAATARPARIAATGLRYEVTAGPGARELAIEAVIPAAAGSEVGVDEETDRFVSDVAVASDANGAAFAPATRVEGSEDGPMWRLPPCPIEGCRVRYKFALDAAARAIGDIHQASREGDAVVTSPTAWLLAPMSDREGIPISFTVRTPPGIGFISGLFRAGDGSYTADVSDLGRAPYSAFGALRVHRAGAEGAAIEVAILPGDAFDLDDRALVSWIEGAARAVRGYFGRPSIQRVLVIVAPTGGHGVGYARTLGNGGASIFVPLGTRSTAAELEGGWAMVHEMLHVAFPNLPREQAWLEEGMATYVEPILRARQGLTTPEQAFARLQKRMPFGLPLAGDRGLDHTPTWGRKYWGGAMFCLLADVEIRRRTGNARSLDDALRAILAAGGNVANRWDVERTIAIGDAATGVTVLAELHARMGAQPVAVELDALWRRLGVTAAGDAVTFDEAAPLAAIRRAIASGAARGEPLAKGAPSVMP